MSAAASARSARHAAHRRARRHPAMGRAPAPTNPDHGRRCQCWNTIARAAPRPAAALPRPDRPCRHLTCPLANRFDTGSDQRRGADSETFSPPPRSGRRRATPRSGPPDTPSPDCAGHSCTSDELRNDRPAPVRKYHYRRKIVARNHTARRNNPTLSLGPFRRERRGAAGIESMPDKPRRGARQRSQRPARRHRCQLLQQRPGQVQLGTRSPTDWHVHARQGQPTVFSVQAPRSPHGRRKSKSKRFTLRRSAKTFRVRQRSNVLTCTTCRAMSKLASRSMTEILLFAPCERLDAAQLPLDDSKRFD